MSGDASGEQIIIKSMENLMETINSMLEKMISEENEDDCLIPGSVDISEEFTETFIQFDDEEFINRNSMKRYNFALDENNNLMMLTRESGEMECFVRRYKPNINFISNITSDNLDDPGPGYEFVDQIQFELSYDEIVYCGNGKFLLWNSEYDGNDIISIEYTEEPNVYTHREADGLGILGYYRNISNFKVSRHKLYMKPIYNIINIYVDNEMNIYISYNNETNDIRVYRFEENTLQQKNIYTFEYTVCKFAVNNISKVPIFYTCDDKFISRIEFTTDGKKSEKILFNLDNIGLGYCHITNDGYLYFDYRDRIYRYYLCSDEIPLEFLVELYDFRGLTSIDEYLMYNDDDYFRILYKNKKVKGITD